MGHTVASNHNAFCIPSSNFHTPQAPASGTLASRILSWSTYAALPAFASRSRVASAASCAALIACESRDGSDAKVRMKDERGSTSVREGGRARV